MKKFYKLYIGKRIDSGMPENATLQGVVVEDLLKPKVRLLAQTLQDGQDLYIVSDIIQAYIRDNLDKIYS